MLQESPSVSRERISISSIQKILFRGLFLLLPLAIFPFPWDWTERSMSLLIFAISSLILGLEIIKLFWEGNLSILKSVTDIGFFLVLLSFLLSTIFSVDVNTSLWGIDGRLGNGLVIFIAILLVTIVSRSFIRGEKDVRSLILFFLIGFLVNNLLSLLSFFNVNIWGIVPVYSDLHQAGLPLLRSGGVHVFVNFISLILSVGFIGEYLIDGRGRLEYMLSLIFALFSVVNIWVYSINLGLGLVLPFLVILSGLLIIVLRFLKLDRETFKQILLFSLILVFLVAIPVIFLQVPRIREALMPETFEMVSELTLGLDLSWIISGAVIVNSLVSGIFGFGLGTYSVAYHMFKPLDMGLLSLGDSTFHVAANEVLTRVASGGLLWFFIWLFVGFLLVRAFVNDLKSVSSISDKASSWRFLIIDVAILTIFIGSFLLPYTVLLMLLLLTLISIRAVVKEYLTRSVQDRFVLKFWAVNMDVATRGNNKSFYNFNIFLTIIVAGIALSIFGFSAAKGIASLHTLRAEAYLVRENQKYILDQTLEPSLEEREAFILSADQYYSQALNLDRNNPLYNRKKTLVLLEQLSIIVEAFSQIDEEDTEQRDQYLSAIMVLKGNLIDFARKATDISPSIYANWITRSTVYTGLVGIGFSEHITDATNSLERAIALNPLNYQLYYSLSQVYIVQGDQESALQLLSRVLEINPRHIPSILLVADLNKELGNVEVYAAYLQAAQQILEQEEATELDIYKEILNALEEVGLENIDLPEDLDIDVPDSENTNLEGLDEGGSLDTGLEGVLE
jgi:tetratricopeptide (TPR) repeat protein